jgi:hypothetical protein
MMPLYAAHAPREPLTLEGADKAVLVPQGFSKAAFVFGPWWLVSNALWRALIGWALACAALFALAVRFGLPLPALALALLALATYLGAEASSLRSAALERAGLPLVDLVAASDEEVGLKTLFARWGASDEEARALAPAGPAVSGTPPPSSFANRDVLGLFPAPGGRA